MYKRQYLKYILASLHHVWASFEGSAEVFNEVHRRSDHVEFVKAFFARNPKGSQKDSNEDQDDIASDESEGKTTWKLEEISRKDVSRAVWNYLVRKEVKDRKIKPIFKGNLAKSFKKFMDQVDIWRSKETYQHNYCNDQCKSRGCGALWVFDGLWKLSYPVCMISSVDNYNDIIKDLIPSVCSNSPSPGQAFCEDHCDELKSIGFTTTELRSFLKHAGANPDEYTKADQAKVNREVERLSALLKCPVRTSTDVQGTTDLLKKVGSADKLALTGAGAACNK